MKSLKDLIENLACLGLMVAWVLGVALAPGFWNVIGATFFPPYAWVLVAQASLRHYGLL
jgi:hypothetical protein